MVTVAQKHVEVPVIETVERVVDVPHVKQVDVPHITTIKKYVDVPHVQTVEKHVEYPMLAENVVGRQEHVHTHLEVQREVHPAEEIHHMEVGMPFETHYAGIHHDQQQMYDQPPGGSSGMAVAADQMQPF
jgi:hypothetical protein